MPYTTNPYIPRLVRKASRHFGIPAGTISKWGKKAERIGCHLIPTRSSRPKHHPRQLSEEIVNKIAAIRLKIKRTSEVVRKSLTERGGASLSRIFSKKR